MRRVAILIEYDGTDFVGWQIQGKGRTVQAVLESSIREGFGEAQRIIGSGRTDSGVHATGQVAHFDLRHSIPIEKLSDALNSKLPADVQILDAKEVPNTFHARRDAKKRRYRYYLCSGSRRPVIDRRKTGWTPYRLDEKAMNSAAQYWIGKHDFTSFRSSHCQAESPVRSIDLFTIERNQENPLQKNLIVFTVEARAFLQNQIRIMVGTLIEIGRGAEKIEWAKDVLEKKDRNCAGQTISPSGLIFEKIFYSDNYELW